MIAKYLKRKPNIHPSVFIADGVKLIGAISISSGSSIWYNTVIRADINTVKIGKNVNVQDGCLLHLEDDRGIIIEDGATIGHGAILHACTIRKDALVGMGAIVLNGAVVGEGAIIGAGAMITPGTNIPKNSLAIGIPGKPVRILKRDEIEKNKYWAKKYSELAQEYKNHER
ncbi:gamma carbonic anhydrase family protein [Candidatus Saganbacteria bacterium]|nr:gamma carbonic anhydrase family protein [Candidatus Saganbacteria bacterium]